MSSDEEDYMSDTFLSKKVEDVRPGIMKTQAQQRRFKIELERIEAKEKEATEKFNKKRLEDDVRDSGLAKPVDHDTSPGFLLMQKMGYKQGMTLGKKQDAIKEPIAIQLKNNRTGLGHEAEKKRKSEDLIRAHQDLIIKRARMHEELSYEFRDRKRELAIQKRILADLFKCQKTCFDLDLQKGLTEPAQSFYWPNYEDETDTEPSNSADPAVTLEPKVESPPKLDPNCLDDSSKLFNLNMYLRDTHFYCPWCGIKFENEDDMGMHCPGLTREEHENEAM